jgi:hypothetical protein
MQVEVVVHAVPAFVKMVVLARAGEQKANAKSKTGITRLLNLRSPSPAGHASFASQSIRQTHRTM